MNPAFSVLVFTVLSGAGYGLITLQVIGHLCGLSLLQERTVLLSGGAIAMALITLGLLSSTLHLANPKNAWRAFARFRTSWLSREALFAVLFYPVALYYLLGVWLHGAELSFHYRVAAVTTALIAMVTLFCTSMIYASLKTIRQWNTRLTPINYLLLGLMSGALLLVTTQSLLSETTSVTLVQVVIVLLIVAAGAKIGYLAVIGQPKGSTINTATGFTQASVRLLDQGHTSNSFLNNEFGYTVGANRLVLLRIVMLVSTFLIPLLLVLTVNRFALLVASLLAIGGLLVERWLFFAEARHVVRLYHGDQRT